MCAFMCQNGVYLLEYVSISESFSSTMGIELTPAACTIRVQNVRDPFCKIVEPIVSHLWNISGIMLNFNKNTGPAFEYTNAGKTTFIL